MKLNEIKVSSSEMNLMPAKISPALRPPPPTTLSPTQLLLGSLQLCLCPHRRTAGRREERSWSSPFPRAQSLCLFLVSIRRHEGPALFRALCALGAKSPGRGPLLCSPCPPAPVPAGVLGDLASFQRRHSEGKPGSLAFRAGRDRKRCAPAEAAEPSAFTWAPR